MNSNDPIHSPLRDVAQSPEATARYLADVQRVLLDIGANLETLARESRVHCRGTHLDGDRRYHARLRAMPVEKAFKDVLKNLDRLTSGMENTAYKRQKFADDVKNLPRERKEKELEKRRKKNPQLQGPPSGAPQETGQSTQHSGYSGPASIYDLDRNRESA